MKVFYMLSSFAALQAALFFGDVVYATIFGIYYAVGAYMIAFGY